MPIVNLMNGEIETKTELKNEINSAKNWTAGTFSNPNMLINGDFKFGKEGQTSALKTKVIAPTDGRTPVLEMET